MKVNWYLFFLGVIVWFTVGILIFDNIAAKLVFIISGSLGALIFAGEKKK